MPKTYYKESQEHSTLGDKMLQHTEVLYSIQKKKKWKPITFQLCPTGICDFNCKFCSVGNRDKTISIPFKTIIKGLKDFRKLGAKALEITGGGNPLLYPKINEVIKKAHQLGYDIGIISNSINPGKFITEESASYLTWYRCSISANHNIPNFNHRMYDLSRVPKGVLSFSYVINKDTTKTILKDIIKLVRTRPDTKFVRICPDYLDNEIISTFRKKWAPMIEKVDRDNKFFFKELIADCTAYSDFCGIGMIRPYVCEDGYVYMCSSFVLRNRKLEPQYRLCHLKDIKKFYKEANKRLKKGELPYNAPISECWHCQLGSNNQFLHNVIRKMEDKNFG
jgi:organic radical activating enzyme